MSPLLSSHNAAKSLSLPLPSPADRQITLTFTVFTCNATDSFSPKSLSPPLSSPATLQNHSHLPCLTCNFAESISPALSSPAILLNHSHLHCLHLQFCRITLTSTVFTCNSAESLSPPLSSPATLQNHSQPCHLLLLHSSARTLGSHCKNEIPASVTVFIPTLRYSQKLVVRGFLQVLRFPPLLHRLVVQPIK